MANESGMTGFFWLFIDGGGMVVVGIWPAASSNYI